MAAQRDSQDAGTHQRHERITTATNIAPLKNKEAHHHEESHDDRVIMALVLSRYATADVVLG
jgi:hypothetical protein